MNQVPVIKEEYIVESVAQATCKRLLLSGYIDAREVYLDTVQRNIFADTQHISILYAQALVGITLEYLISRN